MSANPAAQVRVTNKNNAWKYRDRYAGVDYEFPPGETVSIPAEAAEHIFGFGLGERERFKKFLRAGIANDPKGKEMWERMVVKPVGGNVAPTGVVHQVVEKAKEMFGKAA